MASVSSDPNPYSLVTDIRMHTIQPLPWQDLGLCQLLGLLLLARTALKRVVHGRSGAKRKARSRYTLTIFMQAPKSQRPIRPQTWQESVVKALRLLGGRASLGELYRKVEEVRVADGLPWTIHAKAKVRQVVQLSELCGAGEAVASYLRGVDRRDDGRNASGPLAWAYCRRPV